MTQTLFISDLHLSENNTLLNALFDRFIEKTLSINTINAVDAVYILGDFFNVWIGDDAMGNWERGIAEKLARLVEHHIPVYIMVGNRDFLIQKGFIKLARATLLKDPTVIELYHRRYVLKHGDDLCVEDRSYQCFRRVIRSALIRQVYLALPIVWRRSLAARIRQKSENRGMRPIYAKVSSTLVKTFLQNNEADALIHGHTHCPQIEELVLDKKNKESKDTALHIILSDWHSRGNQLVVSSKGPVFLDYFDALG